MVGETGLVARLVEDLGAVVGVGALDRAYPVAVAVVEEDGGNAAHWECDHEVRTAVVAAFVLEI